MAWMTRRLPLALLVLPFVMLSGCILIGEYDEVYVDPPEPTSIMYEVCYDDVDCFVGYCEELAVPAGPYTEYVNAICTHGCYDDLDCPVSEFTGLPGACVDHVVLGGPITSQLCVERCEFDLDCDVNAGFGCAWVSGERLCIPVR
ncbi:MAG: hypothetical protein AAF436_16140 [Myxococcota bacterium]